MLMNEVDKEIDQEPNLDVKNFLRVILEKAKSIMIDEQSWSLEFNSNPTTDVELSLAEIDFILDFLQPAPKSRTKKIQILPIAQFLEYADKVKRIVNSKKFAWSEKYDMIFGPVIQNGIKSSGVVIDFSPSNEFAIEKNVIDFHNAVEAKANEYRN